MVSGMSMNNASQTKQMPAALRKAAVLLFWLLLWQLLAVIVAKPVILAGPVDTLKALLRLLPEKSFRLSILHTLGRIAEGFFLALLGALVLGGLSFRFRFLAELLAPLLRFMKSVPVASFVILALIWFGSEKLAVAVVIPVVFPLIYFAVQSGLRAADPKLLEMARLFRVPRTRTLVRIYRPAAMPYLMSACSSALAMSWKAGIAAEVIGTPLHSIGEQLYLAKISFATAELFAWTFTIIVCSAAFEKAVLLILRRAAK